MNNNIIDTWQTCLEMISDRGFILDDNIKKMTKETLESKLLTDVLNIVAHKTNGEVLYLEYLLNNKKKSDYIEYLHKTLNIDTVNNKTQVVFVTKLKPTASLLSIQGHKEISIQVFWYKNLLINPSKHVLVPHHELVPKEEHFNILRKYNIVSKAQLPVILYTDAISRYYNFRKGDIVKIQGSLLNINEKIYRYRCVK